MKQDIGSLKLIPSTGGRFEISVNGKLIYSKLQAGKFPDPDTLVKTVRGLV